MLKLMTFRDWWRWLIYPNRAAWDEVYRRRILQFNTEESSDGGRDYSIIIDLQETRKASKEAQMIVARAMTDTISARHWIYTATMAVGQGLKLFEPTVEQCEALENIDPRFEPQDYQQPFQTFCIAFPADYRDRRLVIGEDFWSDAPAEQLPIGAIAYHSREQAKLALTVPLSNGSILTNVLDLRPTGETLHELVLKHKGRRSTGSEVVLSEGEDQLLYQITRLVINACSLLTHFGAAKAPEPPADRRERNRLRHLAQHGRNGAKELAALDLRAHPVCYGFDQSVRLFDRETAGDGSRVGVGAGIGKAPHWRSGTWVNQPYGPGRTERRRIFRRPVLVNEHLLKAPASSTSYTKRGS